MCAVAGMFGAEYPEYSIAISHIGSDCMELGEKLDYRCGNTIKKEVYGKSGINSLKLNFRQGMLTTEKVRRSAIPLIMKSLFFYPNDEEVQNNELTNYILSKVIKNEFDAVFLDLKSGIAPCSRFWIEEADFVIVVLPQEPKVWESFELYEKEYLTGKNYFVLLGGYLEKSKFNRNRYLSRTWGKIQGKLIGIVLINTGFFDAMAEGRTLDFFYKNQKVRKKEENYEFIFQTKRVVRVLRKSIFLSGFENKGTSNVARLHGEVSEGSGINGSFS